MPELTAERIRDAAEVMRLIAIRRGWNQEARRSPLELCQYADALEAEQAAEAKREKRIEELAEDLRIAARNGPLRCLAYVGVNRDTHNAWADLARALLDRYPELDDREPCSKGRCCLYDGHEGRCEQ